MLGGGGVLQIQILKVLVVGQLNLSLINNIQGHLGYITSTTNRFNRETACLISGQVSAALLPIARFIIFTITKVILSQGLPAIYL